MIGLYTPAMLRKYIQDRHGIAYGTYYYRQAKLPQPLTKGPGGTLYLTEAEVRVHIDHWSEWSARKSKLEAAGK